MPNKIVKFNDQDPPWFGEKIKAKIVSSRWHHDITTTEGTKLETTTTIYGLQQLIDEPTHMRKNSTSCTDLIFTNQPNFIVNRGTHPSLHENCKHQITFAKARLRVEWNK